MQKTRQSMLLTGASGMLGGYISALFSDFVVTTLGNSPENDITVDLGKENSLSPLPYFDLVVHAAGVQTPDSSIMINLEGTKRLLAALEKNPPKYFVYISCAEVYGRSQGEEISEKNHLWTSDKFGQSKVLAAREVDEWSRSHSVISTILRPAPMFGKGMKGKWAEIFNAVNSGQYVLVRDNFTERSIVLAYDVARIVREIYPLGGVYNVADPVHHKFVDIIEAMGANSGHYKSPYRLPAKWAKIAARIGDKLPFSHNLPTSESLNFQLSTLTYNTDRLRERLPEFKFHDTVQVIARKDPSYPYIDSDEA